MSTLTNFVGCVKNNIRLKKEYVDVSFSLLVERCLLVLLNEGYILGYRQLDSKTLRIFLKYFKGRSVISDIGSISLSGFRKYWQISDIMANYNSATLTILSTPNGVLSDKTILFKRRIISKSKILNYTTEVSGDKNLAKMSKTFSFTAIDQPIKLKFIDLKLAKFKLDNVVFHKLSILKGFYRPGSSFNKISRRQYIRNRNIQTFYKAYITKSYTMYNSVIQIENHLKNLTFFKFKNFFSTSNYLTFRKSKNFVKCLHSINALEFYSIFYFIFYTKQLTFTGYRFRFSLYIKYLNHLIRVLHPMDLHRLNAQNKLNMGGEPLFYVR